MIAALPMYDRPEIRGATDRFWALIREALRMRGMDAPEALTRSEGSLWPIWEAPDLLLAQTCGLPYRARLHGQVTLVATPDYALPGCAPGYYNSVFVMRRAEATDDPADWAARRLAFNSRNSQSGWAAPTGYMAERGLAFVHVLSTGGHAASAAAVIAGEADIACIDAQTWRLLARFVPETAALTEVARTRSTPGLPYVTRAGQDPAPLRAAIVDAVDGLSPQDRTALDLKGLVVIPASDYLAVPNPPTPPL